MQMRTYLEDRLSSLGLTVAAENPQRRRSKGENVISTRYWGIKEWKAGWQLKE